MKLIYRYVITLINHYYSVFCEDLITTQQKYLAKHTADDKQNVCWGKLVKHYKLVRGKGGKLPSFAWYCHYCGNAIVQNQYY